MVDTIEKTLYPLFLATFILGCGIFKHPLSQLKYYLSIFYILTVWSVYACAFYYIKIRYSLKLLTLNILSFFMVIIHLFVTMISIIMTVCKHEKFYICIRKLDLVNDTLEELGIPKEYYRLKNLIKSGLIVLFLMKCVTWTFDSLFCIDLYNNTGAILIPVVMDYNIHINTTMDIMFMLLLRYIGSRLDKINDYIIQLSKTEDCELRYKWKKSYVANRCYVRNAGSRKLILWIIIHLHLELCQIARNINGFFSIQMTVQMLSYFVVLIGMFNFQYYAILHMQGIFQDEIALKLLLATNTWFIIFLIKLVSLNHTCENVTTKAQKTKHVIHNLTNLICFAEVREEISQFVMQMLLRPLKFSGLGLFYFGYDFIRKFFVWIFTITLFMVQVGVAPMTQVFDDKFNITYDQ